MEWVCTWYSPKSSLTVATYRVSRPLLTSRSSSCRSCQRPSHTWTWSSLNLTGRAGPRATENTNWPDTTYNQTHAQYRPLNKIVSLCASNERRSDKLHIWKNECVYTWKIKLVFCPAWACSRTPSFDLVRNTSPMYHGVLMVTSFFRSHHSALLPRKRWGWDITVEEPLQQYYHQHLYCCKVGVVEQEWWQDRKSQHFSLKG